MQSHTFKNRVTALLILFFVFSPVWETKQVRAQTTVSSYPTTGSYSYGSGGTSGGLQGYIKGLGPAITQLPKCKKRIKSAIKNLFGKSKGVVSPEATGALGKSLNNTIDESQAESDAIASYDKKANEKLDDTLAVSKSTKNAVESLDENSSCLDSIGKLVIDRMIQRITLATVEWIKTGNSGGPAFVQDPGRFLRDIAKEEILTFGLELNLGANCQAMFSGNILGTTGNTNINSPGDCLNPYAKSWFASQAGAFNKKFNDNARYSLNELIAETTPQYTGASFRADFAAGGWNAWTALTTVPANNPIGFAILAETELSKRLAGTQKSTAEQIQNALIESNGFLGDYRCADPEGTTKDQHKAALESGQKDLACKRWEYVTPGRTVAEEALKISHFQENKLLRADTLNDAMAAIVDALIQRFSNELYDKGLAGFSDEGSDGGIILNGYAIEGGYGITQVEKDYPEYLQGSDWFNAHPDFNIRTDLTQAIIDEQRIFVEKLEKIDHSLEQVSLWAKQADYCLPGPSESSHRKILDTEIFGNQKEDLVPPAFRQIIEVLRSTDRTGGILGGIAESIFGDPEERLVKRIAATILPRTFQVHIYGAFDTGDNNEQDQAMTKGDLEGVANNMLASYYNVITNMYFNGSKSLAPMPLVTNEIRTEVEKIPAYRGIIDENEDRVGLMKAVIQRLSRIKEEIEDLGPVPGPSDPGFAEYEDKMKPIIAEFGRLTSEMVTGDQIAQQHKLLIESEDKEKYVRDDLLTGPGGCEEEMLKLYEEDLPTYSKFYRRQPYLEPIFYLYGSGVQSNEPQDPHIRTIWSESNAKNWSTNDGFLFGSVYWNYWARPYDGGNPFTGSSTTPNPPNYTKLRANTCTEFVDIVYFSYPSSDKAQPGDFGGLEPSGAGPYGPNNCGVVVRGLEDLIGLY